MEDDMEEKTANHQQRDIKGYYDMTIDRKNDKVMAELLLC